MSEEKQTIHLDDLIEEPEEEKAEVKTISGDNVEKEKETPSNIITPRSASGDVSKAASADISELAEFEEEENGAEKFAEREEQLMDEGIERAKQQVLDIVEPVKQRARELKEQEELENMEKGIVEDDIDDLSSRDDTAVPTTKKEVDLSEATTTEIDEKDFDNLEDMDLDSEEEDKDLLGEDEDDEEETQEESDEELQERIKEATEVIGAKIKSSSEELDLSKFKVGTAPISINKSIKFAGLEDQATESNTGSVPLFNSGRMIKMTGLKGSELALFVNDLSDQANQNQALKNTFRLMYRHDVSDDKPSTYQAWAKSISDDDINHMYFCLYKATFGGSNYISFDCKQCGSFFMTENIPMDKMWRINKDIDPKDKKRLEDIMNHGKVSEDLESFSELYPVSDAYAIRIKPLTLYNDLEDTFIPDEMRRKYQATIRIAQFTQNLYYIDKEHGTLRPIDFKPNTNSILETLKKKLLVIDKMVKSLTSDQFSILNSHIFNLERKMRKSSTVIDYFLPAVDCLGTYKKGDYVGQNCTHHFDEQPMHPLNMLFTRHQLGLRSI